MKEMKEILEKLFQGYTLTEEEARNILLEMAMGNINEYQMSAFLTIYRMRKITPEELSGFRNALLQTAIKIPLERFKLIDLCGTGGDNKNTFNISTLASFVTAAAGAYVVKHGNYAISSGCGSSNILEYFGYKFSNDKNVLEKQLEKANICYLHAPLFNPLMKNFAKVRKNLGFKTFFNIMGPMINPATPENQLIGVYDKDIIDLYAQVYDKNKKNYAVVYSTDGYDEISLTSDFILKSNILHTRHRKPEHLGFKRISDKQLYGGHSVKEAAEIFINILQGKGTEAQNNVVIANATVALAIYFPEKRTEQCKEMAQEALFSGKAFKSFKNLINFN